MPFFRRHPRQRLLLLSLTALLAAGATAPAFAASADAPATTANVAPEPGLLFSLSGDHGTTADFSAGGTPEATFVSDVTTIPDGERGAALRCGNLQRLAWWAPGNIYAQRGTLAFFWRAREPVGPTEFPVFRVGFGDHSSWDMVWLRLDYNGHGFDAFVTDASLARTRVSATLQPFPAPDQWIHLAFSWDETRGVRLYINGRLAASKDNVAVFNTALDQFGPHSRIISPHNVQSDYNFTRGGDIDELRIYDHMLNDASIAALARNEVPAADPRPARSLADAATRAEWWHRYGWDRTDTPPPPLSTAAIAVRKVEIHEAYDLKRWWWKATDGIRETTWPGVYNRSRLPGRNDYFQLPDWDCYALSGRAITFTLPDEPWNQLELSGSAWGKMSLLASEAAPKDSVLFERPRGLEKTVHRLSAPITGRKIRFENVEPEEPIGELVALNVTAGSEPAGSTKLAYRLALAATAPTEASTAALAAYIAGRHPADERTLLVAQPISAPGSAVLSIAAPDAAIVTPATSTALPLVHILIPNTWDKLPDGLDGIALDLPALAVKPTHGKFFPLNLQVKDPIWPMRDMLDFSFSVKPGEPHTLWLDLRDRLLPAGRGLYLTLAGAGADFTAASLAGAEVRLVFKSREAARPEHELDRFTQARDSYAMLVEEHPHSPNLKLWVRFETDLKDLLRVNPEHALGRAYAAAGMGAPRPPFAQPVPPAGVPLWAFRQTELLGRVKKFVTWYIDNRQIDDGELGGGLSDDTDLTNLWPGVALMGSEPDKIATSLRRVLDACYANGMFTRGLNTIQTDELHNYEEGINCLGQNLILDYASPRQLERAMENARAIAGITGINAAGHRHIRSSYYSATKMAVEGPWGWAKPYSYLALQPSLLLVDFNGNPSAKQNLVELADGLVAHRHVDATTGRAGPFPSIQFTTDREATANRNYFPWPLFWSAWRWTGDHRYLDPIFDGGTSSVMAISANALDLLNLRADWGKRILAGERGRATESRVADGRGSDRAASYRDAANAHFAWQLSGDKAHLEKLYAAQIEECALLEFINTEGSLWIDRVGVPTIDLQRARLGGVALARNSTVPGHTVSWRFAAPANDQSVAVLLPDATPTAFKVIAYNLSTAPVHATMTGWLVDPGQWEITQGIAANDGDTADSTVETRTAVFERTRSLEFTLPPRATTILTLKLKTPGTPYWKRPDLGLDASDVVVRGREVRVTVHSLGSVAAPASSIALRDATGRVIATAPVPALAAPVDLLPQTATVLLKAPAGANLTGATVELNPDHPFEEITERNNAVKL